jgi:hypothetical protein
MPMGIYPRKPCSEETKRKISEAHLGMRYSEERNKNVSNSLRGRKLSEETKQKISKAIKGHPNYLKYHTKETRKKIGLMNKGSKCHFWKGGITELQKQIRCCFEYRQWRSDVFTRDNFACQNCGNKGGRLVAHHIKEFSKIIEEYQIKTLEQALNCDEMWNINNGQTLCWECHKLTNNYGLKVANKKEQLK